MSPLVLLHGFSGSPASFDEVISRLGPRIRGVCRPALLGHGPAPVLGPGRFEQEVDRLAACIRSSGHTGAHLCGYSLGARLGLGLLARHTSLFRAATLIGLHPGLPSLEERAVRIGSDERWCALLAREGLAAFLRAWEAQPLFATQARLPADQLERQRRIREGHCARGLERALRVLGLGQMPNYRGVLSGQPLRVRLLVGSRDAKFVELGRQLAAASRRIRLDVIEGAGHNLLLEAPGPLAAMLTSGLEDRA